MTDETIPPSTIEQLSPYLTREWLDDGQIVIYTTTSISRETIDVWVESVLAMRATWSLEHPYLTMYDGSRVDASLTPYMRGRFQELMQAFRDVPGRTALILKKSFVAQLVQLFVDSHFEGTRVRKIFFNREEGLNWLRETLTERK